jgi:protein TonB
MENKKNTKADLSRRSLLFFQFGLILALLLVWQLIEWKVDSGPLTHDNLVFIDQFEEEAAPVTKVEEVKPPEPPREIVKEIDIKKDDLDVKETEIASTETDDKILEVSEVKFVEKEDEIEDYNIHSVEEAPIFPGCEGFHDNDARKECFSEKVNKLVGRTFDSSLGSELGLSGLHRIYVSFRVEKDGSTKVIGVRGPHPKLEEEAIRVINEFPELIPGKQGGRAVGVLYSLPITFRVQN